MFERFNENARRSLFFARYEASCLGHREIGTEHLLFGLLREADEALIEVFASRRLNLRRLRSELVGRQLSNEPVTSSPDLPLSSDSKRAIAFAVFEADGLGHSQIGTGHLLLGLLRITGSTAANYLTERGFDIRELRSELAHRQRLKKPGDHTPFLTKYARDLTALAARGVFDPLIGRDDEVERIVRILSRRTKNNPLLLGEAGVGKTAIVEGLASRIMEGKVGSQIAERRILAIDFSLLVAGTKYRGQFEERMKGLLTELRGHPEIIVFIDEIHVLIGTGSAEGSLDAANILKPALARGEIACIGATTMSEYRRRVEKDRALSRRFQVLTISEPGADQTMAILAGVKQRYEEFHGVRYTAAATAAAVGLAGRYISDRRFPDKAIDVLDEAGASVKLVNLEVPDSLRRVRGEIRRVEALMKEAISDKDFERAVKLREQELGLREELDLLQRSETELPSTPPLVHRDDIEEVVATWTGIPVTSLREAETDRLRRMEEILGQRVVGQHEAISALARAIRRSRLGVAGPQRPIGSFVFIGPSGVGKTEVTRQLADFLFSDPRRLVRFDMSEYMEKHTVSRLVGSPPGYVGFEEGGQLSEQIRRNPYSVVLFDEIEKAHADVYNLLLQVLEDGRLTDSYGNLVDFSNTLIIMTSNLGSRDLAGDHGMGFGNNSFEIAASRISTIVDKELRRHFPPEFLNRIDDVIVFRPLSQESLLKVAELLLEETFGNLALRKIEVEYDSEVPGWLFSQCPPDPLAGARPLRRLVRRQVEDVIAEYLMNHPADGVVRLVLRLGAEGPVVFPRDPEPDFDPIPSQPHELQAPEIM